MKLLLINEPQPKKTGNKQPEKIYLLTPRTKNKSDDAKNFEISKPLFTTWITSNESNYSDTVDTVPKISELTPDVHKHHEESITTSMFPSLITSQKWQLLEHH